MTDRIAMIVTAINNSTRINFFPFFPMMYNLEMKNKRRWLLTTAFAKGYCAIFPS
jgi:hypothetical protein